MKYLQSLKFIQNQSNWLMEVSFICALSINENIDKIFLVKRFSWIPFFPKQERFLRQALFMLFNQTLNLLLLPRSHNFQWFVFLKEWAAMKCHHWNRVIITKPGTILLIYIKKSNCSGKQVCKSIIQHMSTCEHMYQEWKTACCDNGWQMWMQKKDRKLCDLYTGFTSNDYHVHKLL